MYGYKYLAISDVILIRASNSLNLILLLIKSFLIGLLHLNFHIETLLDNTESKSSLLATENNVSDPLRSIVSIANKSRSNLSKALFDINLLFLKVVMI